MSRAKLIKDISLWPSIIEINQDDFYFSRQIAEYILAQENIDIVKEVASLAKKCLDDFKAERNLPKTENDLLIFIDLVLMDKAFKKFPLFQKISLAHMLLNIAHKPSNYGAAKFVSEHLAFTLIGINPLRRIEENKQRKRLGQIKGGEITGRKLKEATKIQDAEMMLWIRSDRQQNGKRHQANRIMKKFSVKERKARKILAAAFPSESMR